MPSSAFASDLRLTGLAHSSGSVSPAVTALRIETAFADRTWSIVVREGEARCQAFFILHGEGTFVGDDGTTVELTAPFMLWLPRLAAGEFRLPAGSDGIVASIAENFILRTVGDSPVAALLRPLLSRTTVAPHDKLPPTFLRSKLPSRRWFGNPENKNRGPPP